MMRTNLHSIELENNRGAIFARFNTADEYEAYMCDLSSEYWDNVDEDGDDLSESFKVWYIVMTQDDELTSLTEQQYREQRGIDKRYA